MEKPISGAVSTESVIEDLGDDGLVESSDRHSTSSKAKIRFTDEGLVADYDEESQGGVTHVSLTVTGGEIRVERHGAIQSTLIFAEGECKRSIYKIGQYAFDTEIFTKKIRNNFTRPSGSIHIIYDMTIGGARKHTRLKITVTEDSNDGGRA